jgi:hypothetical protein
MTMPWVGAILLGRDWLTLEKFQVERFEQVLVKEVLANQELVKTLQGKLGELKSYRGAKGE